jgi:PAS domain S-box-containing protein
MSFEEKLRRVAAWSGLTAGVFGVLRLLVSPALPEEQGMTLLITAGVVLCGAALWFDARGRSPLVRPVLAALALACAAGALIKLRADGYLGIAELSFRDPAPRPPQIPYRPLPHAALVLAIAALGISLLRRPGGKSRHPLSALLACTTIASASAALIIMVLVSVVQFARPLQIAPLTALALLLIGIGMLLARPDNQLFRILFSKTPAGALARRLFYGVTVLPAALIGLIVVSMQFGVVQQRYGIALVVLALILSGLILAFLSAETAIIIDLRREEADQSRMLLTARLQEQAAQLQETVSIRTRELRDANTHLRAVAEANARLALVAHHTTNGVVITGADGRVEWVNAAFQAMSGYALDEIKGRKPGHVLVGPNTDPATVARLREAERTGSPCKAEILNYTKQGRPYWQVIDIQPVRDASGRVINFISVQTDVTENRAATERLQHLNQRLELATRAAALGVWEWDALLQKNIWDDRTLEIYGVARADFRGTGEEWTNRLHPDDRATAIAEANHFINSGQELDHTFRILRQVDGTLRHVRSRALAQRDSTGKLLRVIGTERDITAERGAVQQTETLNERLRLALRSSNFGVWELDIATDRLAWDDRMLEIYGLDRSTFDGDRERWRATLHPDDAAAAQETVRRVISGEVPAYDTEFRIARSDGSLRHIEAHGYLQRDADGHAIRLVGLNRDITGERQLQQALDLAEQRWQLALESTNDGVWDWDMQTGALYHDERWARMLGYESSEISTEIDGWRHLVHPADLPGCDAVAREHAEGRSPFYQHEYRMLAKTGEWKWILDRGKVVTRAPDGRALRMVGTHTDVTARRELEERFRRTEALSTHVSRIALIGGWELNLETREVTWSEGTFRLHELDDHQRQPTLEEACSYYPEDALATIDAALYSRTPADPAFDFELPLITAKGRRIWVRILAHALFRDDKPTLLQGAIQDVTARHESDEARRELEGQLFQAQKMETLGTLAGGIAHDFNNLLTGIIGYHELAADSVPEDHPARACLSEARNASLRARELVEQILTFGRQSAGGGHTPLDVGLVVEEARRFLRATLPATVVIEHRLAPYCPNVLGDATQIHQVLLNLGSNAAHAMRHHGGILTIAVEPAEVTPDLALSLGGPPAGSYVRLSVTDTGHGMDEATRRRIFDPFFTTKNTREGTGLGLAVVHGIVRAHRGAIDVESSVGAGSTFHIYLPAATEEGTRNEADLTGAPRGAGEFICVVDDEEVVGSCTKLVLESKGYRSVVYGSAEQCLEVLEHNPAGCALLVTDQTMPGMQGTELVATLRKVNPSLPVVIMSGYFSKIAPHVLDELGQVELLAKPFTTDELAHAVHRALHPDKL